MEQKVRDDRYLVPRKISAVRQPSDAKGQSCPIPKCSKIRDDRYLVPRKVRAVRYIRTLERHARNTLDTSGKLSHPDGTRGHGHWLKDRVVRYLCPPGSGAPCHKRSEMSDTTPRTPQTEERNALPQAHLRRHTDLFASHSGRKLARPGIHQGTKGQSCPTLQATKGQSCPIPRQPRRSGSSLYWTHLEATSGE